MLLEGDVSTEKHTEKRGVNMRAEVGEVPHQAEICHRPPATRRPAEEHGTDSASGSRRKQPSQNLDVGLAASRPRYLVTGGNRLRYLLPREKIRLPTWDPARHSMLGGCPGNVGDVQEHTQDGSFHASVLARGADSPIPSHLGYPSRSR